MSEVRHPRQSYLQFKPLTVRGLSAVALLSLHGWFLLKFLLVQPSPTLQVFVGFLGLLGMLTAIVVFLSRYNFQANAAKKDLDERELMQRNAAYFRTHQYMIVAVLAGLLVMHVWERAAGLSISVGQMSNFLTLLFFSGLIMPATVLAWQDTPEE